VGRRAREKKPESFLLQRKRRGKKTRMVNKFRPLTYRYSVIAATDFVRGGKAALVVKLSGNWVREKGRRGGSAGHNLSGDYTVTPFSNGRSMGGKEWWNSEE